MMGGDREGRHQEFYWPQTFRGAGNPRRALPATGSGGRRQRDAKLNAYKQRLADQNGDDNLLTTLPTTLKSAG